MKIYMIFMFSMLIIATGILYIGGGINIIVSTYIGAFLGIVLLAVCFILLEIIIFIYELFN